MKVEEIRKEVDEYISWLDSRPFGRPEKPYDLQTDPCPRPRTCTCAVCEWVRTKPRKLWIEKFGWERFRYIEQTAWCLIIVNVIANNPLGLTRNQIARLAWSPSESMGSFQIKLDFIVNEWKMAVRKRDKRGRWVYFPTSDNSKSKPIPKSVPKYEDKPYVVVKAMAAAAGR